MTIIYLPHGERLDIMPMKNESKYISVASGKNGLYLVHLGKKVNLDKLWE